MSNIYTYTAYYRYNITHLYRVQLDLESLVILEVLVTTLYTWYQCIQRTTQVSRENLVFRSNRNNIIYNITQLYRV